MKEENRNVGDGIGCSRGRISIVELAKGYINVCPLDSGGWLRGAHVRKVALIPLK
jgi:hypothetical protein